MTNKLFNEKKKRNSGSYSSMGFGHPNWPLCAPSNNLKTQPWLQKNGKELTYKPQLFERYCLLHREVLREQAHGDKMPKVLSDFTKTISCI